MTPLDLFCYLLAVAGGVLIIGAVLLVLWFALNVLKGLR